MKILITLLLLLFALQAHAAAPSIDCTPSITDADTAAVRTAPVAVFMDCTASTGPTNAFRDAFYYHQVNQAGAGSWSTGIGGSKNLLIGPVAAYVFETAGSKSWRACMVDSSGVSSCTTKTLTVVDPDVTFSGTNTICYSNASTFTGCPAGATQTGSTSAFSLASCTAGKRCLFERTGTFMVSAQQTLNTATGLLGAYGSGAKPIINSSVSAASIIKVSSTSNPASNWRIMDLDLRQTANQATGITLFSANSTRITVLRVDMTNVYGGVVCDEGFVNDQIAVFESTFTSNAATDGYPLFCGASRLSAVGNNFNRQSTEFGPVRIISGDGIYIANNTLSSPGASNHVIKMHGPSNVSFTGNTTAGSAVITNVSVMPTYMKAGLTVTCTSCGSGRTVALFDEGASTVTMSDVAASNATGVTVTVSAWTGVYTENGNLTGNKIDGGLAGVIVEIGPQNDVKDERVRKVLFQNNLVISGAAGVAPLRIYADDITVRSNIFDMSAVTGTSGCTGVDVYQRGAEPAHTNVWVGNNTFYGGASTCTFRGVRFRATASDSFAINNLAYGATFTTPDMILDEGSGNTIATNSDDAQVSGTNPFLATPSTSNLTTFQPSTAYADDGGTASFPATKSDFFNCWDKTSSVNRIGAVVPRASAICRGAP